jgi:hypothetical protein
MPPYTRFHNHTLRGLAPPPPPPPDILKYLDRRYHVQPLLRWTYRLSCKLR